MIEAVLFDIGDTLIHFDRSHPRRLLTAAVRPVHEQIVSSGFPAPDLGSYEKVVWNRIVRSFLWARVRRRDVDLVRTLGAVHRRLGIPLSGDKLTDVMATCAGTIGEFLHTDPQAEPVVRALHSAGFRLAIVSNVFLPGAAVDGALRMAGLFEYFATRIYASDVGYRKPQKGIFRLALRRLNVEPARAIYVGDHLRNDIHGASRVGMCTAWLAARGSTASGRRGPDYVIRELSQLLPILQVG